MPLSGMVLCSSSDLYHGPGVVRRTWRRENYALRPAGGHSSPNPYHLHLPRVETYALQVTLNSPSSLVTCLRCFHSFWPLGEGFELTKKWILWIPRVLFEGPVREAAIYRTYNLPHRLLHLQDPLRHHIGRERRPWVLNGSISWINIGIPNLPGSTKLFTRWITGLKCTTSSPATLMCFITLSPLRATTVYEIIISTISPGAHPTHQRFNVRTLLIYIRLASRASLHELRG